MLFDTYKMMLKSLLPGEMRKKMGEGSAGLGIKYLILGAFFAGIISFIIFMGPTLQDLASLGFGGTLIFMLYAFILIMMSVVTLLVGSAVVGVSATYKLARMIGGSGSYNQHLHIFGLVCGGLAVAGAVLAVIPYLGMLLLIVLWVYSMHLAFVIFSDLHKLGFIPALLLAGLPALMGVVLSLVIFAMSSMPIPVMGQAPI